MYTAWAMRFSGACWDGILSERRQMSLYEAFDVVDATFVLTS